MNTGVTMHAHHDKFVLWCGVRTPHAAGVPAGGSGSGRRGSPPAGGAGSAMSRGLQSKRASAAALPPREHAVSVWCETDIFDAVGLHYVPPHMRHFHGVSS